MSHVDGYIEPAAENGYGFDVVIVVNGVETQRHRGFNAKQALLKLSHLLLWMVREIEN